jgi:transposase
MATWSHERLLGNLRRRIVSAVEESGISKAQAARTFSVSLSSVKRYVEKAHRGESLAPKKRPGSAPKLDEKARTLFEEVLLKERPFATLQERCDYMEVMTGLSVSRSTMWSAIARIGPPRKKGGESPQSATRSSSEQPGG